MRVNVQRLNRLPRQAWLLHYRDGAANVGLGGKVSLSDHGFFEGGWALTPGPQALLASGIHLGSGAAWRSGQLTLISPSHSLESIWTAEVGGAVWAANSLALLITATRPADFRIWRVHKAIRSVNAGLPACLREIYQDPGIRICRFVNAFVDIDGDRPPAERQQRQAADFETFESYVAFLTGAVAEALESYGEAMTVYLSRGYDSPAVATLARRLGPVTAICIDRTAAGKADDGSMIAAALGIPSVLAERKTRATRIVEAAARRYLLEVISPDDYEDVFEFFCGVHIADECLRAPDELVADRAVLTGWYGDTMWGLKGEPWRDLVRAHVHSAGIGLGEFRLRTGFMHVPVPGLAFNRAATVRAISASDAMRPWRLGSGYDRPIPRRITEEGGVPRTWFGVEKQFTATQVANLHRIAPVLFAMQVARYAAALEDWPFARARAAPTAA